MCRWVAHIGDKAFLSSVLVEGENSLTKQSVNCTKGDPAVNGDGFGLGWFSDKSEPAIYRDVMPAWHNPNLLNLSAHISSPLFFGHIRAATGGGISIENCHPFKYKNYMFMHNGMIQNYDFYRRKVEVLLNDEFYNLKAGSTDSEVMFYLLMQYGFFDNPVPAVQELIKNIELILSANKKTEKDYLRMSLCLADENSIYLIRYSTNPNPPSVFYQKSDNGWTISSEPTSGQLSDWEKVDEDSLLIFKKNDISFEKIKRIDYFEV